MKSEWRIPNESSLRAGDEEIGTSRPPRLTDATVPRISEAATGGSDLIAASPRVINRGTLESSTRPTSRCVHSRPSRTKRIKSPRDGSVNPSARTINSSPGQSAGTMLLPATRSRTSWPARMEPAASSHPMRSRLLVPASNQRRRFIVLIERPVPRNRRCLQCKPDCSAWKNRLGKHPLGWWRHCRPRSRWSRPLTPSRRRW